MRPFLRLGRLHLFTLYARRYSREILFHSFDRLLLIKLSRDHDNRRIGNIVVCTIVNKVLPCHRLHNLLSSCNRPSRRLIAIHQFHKRVLHLACRQICKHIDLFNNHSLFLFYFCLIKLLMQINIRHYVQDLIEVGRSRLCVITSVFLPRERIIRCANTIKLTCDRKSRRTLFSSLKTHMFQEMREAVYLLCFVFRTRFHQYQYRSRQARFLWH